MNALRSLLAALAIVLFSAGSVCAQMLAEDRFESNLNLISFTQDPGPGTYSQPTGDGFEIYRVGISASIPMGLIDDSHSVFPFDQQGIIDASSDSDEFKSDAWFGVIDTVNDDKFPITNPGIATATWVFDISQDKTGALEVSVEMGSMGAFSDGRELLVGEPSVPVIRDFFNWTYSIDGGESLPLFTSKVDALGQHEYEMAGGEWVLLSAPLHMTTTDNQTILLDNKLQPITSPIIAEPNNSTITIVLEAQADGGSKAYAFDNIVVEEVLSECEESHCTVAGDYNASGVTELGDLNLVLFGWDMPDQLLPVQWVNERPITTTVGLQELNRVLFNWGAGRNGPEVVPEPTTWLLFLTGWIVCFVSRHY